MLKEFAFLGEEKAYEVVVTDSKWVANTREITSKDGYLLPKIEGAEDE